jgi:hypothetical protein
MRNEAIISRGPRLTERNKIYFRHLAFAAFLAISDLFLAVRDLALAFPPFSPPNRPNATAAGFFLGSSIGVEISSPTAWSTLI